MAKVGAAVLVAAGLAAWAWSPSPLDAQEPAAAQPRRRAVPVRPVTALAGSWGTGPAQFGLLRGELPLGPSCFTLDTARQVYVCDPYNHRVQVFSLDGSLSRVVATPDGPPLSFDDMCVARDWSIYATDGKLMYVWAPGAGQFTRPETQPLPPGQRESAGLLRLAVVAGRDAQGAWFYLEQGGRRPDGRGTTFINQYYGQFTHEGALEGYDLCADVEARRVCAILGPRLAGPEPWEPEVLLIETASGQRRSVKLAPGEQTVRRADVSLVGCDADGRLYLLVSRTLAEPTASSVRVHAPDGSLLGEVRLRRWGSNDVFLGRAFPRQLIRVDAQGDIYVASASLQEGYRIEKYSWRERAP